MIEHAVLVAPGTVRIERLLPGPIERIWAYLIESEKRRQWLAAGEMEARPGGRVEFIWRNSELGKNDVPPPAGQPDEVVMRAEIVECDPPRLLVITWNAPAPGHGSQVRFELAPRRDKVELVITHSGLAIVDDMTKVSGGWHTHLDILAACLDGREPEGFWRSYARLSPEYAKRLRNA